MYCDDIERLLLRSLEGRLEADEGHQLERHLAQCDACRESLEAQRRVATVLSERPVVEAHIGLRWSGHGEPPTRRRRGWT